MALAASACGSSSGDAVEVPDVVGEPTEFASGIITGAGLDYVVEPDTSGELADGQVVSQIPSAGTTVEPGSVVKIFEAASVSTTSAAPTSTTAAPMTTTSAPTTSAYVIPEGLRGSSDRPEPLTGWEFFQGQVYDNVEAFGGNPVTPSSELDDAIVEIARGTCDHLEAGIDAVRLLDIVETAFLEATEPLRSVVGAAAGLAILACVSAADAETVSSFTFLWGVRHG